jgi:hypothetical protein
MTTATPPQTDIERLIAQTQMTSGLMGLDIQHMSHEMLAADNGGKARCGYDVICEVIDLVNFVTAQLSGEDVSLPEPQGWQKAPDHRKDREGILEEFQSASDRFTKALSTASDETLAKVVQSPLGEVTVLRFAQIMPPHIMYHSGQLNYIQTLHGDDDFHWGG